MNKNYLIIALLFGTVVLFGCTQAASSDGTPPIDAGTQSGAQEDAMTGDAMDKTGEAMDKDGEAMAGDAMDKTGDAMNGTTTGEAMDGDAMSADAMENDSLGAPFYEPFTSERFEAAKDADKTILLEFYANWCPLCKTQKPILEDAFASLNDPRIVGFQVNYNDSETEQAEVDLARKYGITYQHTHIVIDAEGNQLFKKTGEWSKEQIIADLTGAAS